MNRPSENKGPFWLWPLGACVGVVFTGGLYLGVFALLTAVETRGMGNAVAIIGLPSLFLVPICGGIAASYCWRRVDPSIGAIAVATLVMTIAALAISMVAFGEGVICLLIVSPLFYIALFTGAVIAASGSATAGDPGNGACCRCSRSPPRASLLPDRTRPA